MFLCVGIIPSLIIALVSVWSASESLEHQIYNQLTSIKFIKKSQVEQFFETTEANLTVIDDAVADYLTNSQSKDLAVIGQQHDYFFHEFIELEGYEDFYIIKPNGDIVYSVEKRSDYNSNLLTGASRNTNFGAMFQQVKTSRQLNIQDFELYSVNGNTPQAFAGMPLYDDNQFIGIVALQFGIDSINKFMQQRDGMGETGESYLVGQDLRMRSDSFLDPNGHSVEASFSGTVAKNGVNTRAVKQALAGETGTEIIIDYNGNPVLSSYTPIHLHGINWALLVEIDESEAFASIYRLEVIIGGILLLTALAIIAVAIIIARSILMPIGGEPEQMGQLSELIADGDLSTQLDESKKVTGVFQSMIKMSKNLHQVVGTIVESSERLSLTSEQTRSASEQSKHGLQEQSANIDTVSAALNEMSAAVEDVANNARTVADFSISAQKTSEIADESVEKTIKSMTSLAQEVNLATDSIQNVESNSQQIGTVLEVIRGIADQTNLLALNAAIEAARAGEHGRGFAVVADEVRQLAQKTQDSTSDIERMIVQLQAGTQESVNVMQGSRASAEKTIELATSSSSAIKKNLTEIKNIALNAEQIASATQQQSVAGEEVNQSIVSINQAAIDNAASAEQVSQASEELSQLALQLKKITGQFKLS